MKAIIIGAGRGKRLGSNTDHSPKCFTEIGNQRILDWIIQSFNENGIENICFIGGYQMYKIKKDYPQFKFCHNVNWERNNILASLMYAESEMDESFICCYSDILFTPKVVKKLLDSKFDVSLVIDTHWLDRYQHRSDHPPHDAEKVLIEGKQITRVHRDIRSSQAYGEYIGVAKFTAKGAELLKNYYHQCQKKYDGKPFREAVTFEKAYLIHLFQEMIEQGEILAHIDTPGGYMEIDTPQDLELARKNWSQEYVK